MTQTTHNDELSTLFTNKKLIIGDYVMEDDIPKIYHYFDNFNIASIKDITYYDNPYDNLSVANQFSFYGYVIIDVEEWHNNVGARNFYKMIEDNECRMVYDDPNYWQLEFYNDVLNNLNLNTNPLQENEVVVNVLSDESSNSEVSENEELNNVYSESDEDDVESEVDDLTKDPNYDIVESDKEEDYAYEYLIPTIKKMKKEIRSRSKAKAKAKFQELKTENEELKTENEELKKLLLKNNNYNKNYLKNNKRKSYKNDWTRRLRQKVEVTVF